MCSTINIKILYANSEIYSFSETSARTLCWLNSELMLSAPPHRAINRFLILEVSKKLFVTLQFQNWLNPKILSFRLDSNWDRLQSISFCVQFITLCPWLYARHEWTRTYHAGKLFESHNGFNINNEIYADARFKTMGHQ